MSHFRAGQKAVCIGVKGWERLNTSCRTTTTTGWWLWKKTTTVSTPNQQVPGPAKDEVVFIVKIAPDGYLGLLGYEQHGHYDPTAFRPFDNLEEALERITEEAKKDELVHQP